MSESECTRTVILVEDDDVDAMAVQRSLARELPDVRLVRAADGLEALRVLRKLQPEMAGRYVVLVDLNMPRMSGLELLQELRKDPLLSSAVAFVHTTSKDEKDLAAVYRLNVAGYLVKTFNGAGSGGVGPLLREYFKAVTFPPATG